MSKVVLFGSGRGADVAYRFLTHDSEHEIVGFTADGAYIRDSEFRGLPLVPFESVEERFPPEDFKMFILLGYQKMNQLRKAKYEDAKRKGYECISYIASNIFRAEPINVGENCFILDNQSISLDVEIGNNVVAWSSNHVGDCTKVSDHAWLSSHCTLAANVKVREGAFLGIGCTVANKVEIGSGAFVGAHAFAASDVGDDAVLLASGPEEGLPAKTFMRMMEAQGKL